MSSKIFRLFACALCLGGFSTGHAQTTFASITGLISDSSGAAVPGAKVTAVSVETNISYPGVSNAEGIYTIPQLKEGVYTLRVEAPGFTTSRRRR